MALQKLTYTDGITVIPASNLNAIQDAIIDLENQQGASEISDDLKAALLQIASKVAYIDDQGQTYYNALYNALYPPKTLFSITAVFTQGSTVVYDNASLDSLKSMLVVTAHYTDGTSEAVASNLYTLSGTLTVGTSTVTVSYNSKTTTFTVNVTAAPTLSSISAVYTQSGTVYDTDTLDSLKADLVVTATYDDSSTQTVPAADYTLSGTLTAGTSTITVSFGGKTTTFNVTVKGRAVLSTTPIAWNTASGSLVTISGSDVTVMGNGSGYPNAVLNNLLYQLSQTTGKRVHIIGDVVVSGLTSGSYQCVCGLFPNQNPNTMGNRVVSGGGSLSPSMLWSSNGTYHFDSVFYPQEATAWESYSGYVGFIAFGNSPNSGASATFSNMEAFLEDV